jgi:hypothetical protein
VGGDEAANKFSREVVKCPLSRETWTETPHAGKEAFCLSRSVLEREQMTGSLRADEGAFKTTRNEGAL